MTAPPNILAFSQVIAADAGGLSMHSRGGPATEVSSGAPTPATTATSTERPWSLCCATEDELPTDEL